MMLGIIISIGILYLLSYVLPVDAEVTGSARFISSRSLLSRKHNGITVDGKRKLTEKQSKHTLVVAETGAGKTTKMIIPSILQHENASLMVLDPKGGELLHLCAPHLEEKGYAIKVLDYNNPASSFFFNPLKRCSTDAELRQLAQNIYDITSTSRGGGDKIWENGAIRLMVVLMSCIKRMPEEYQTLATLYRFLTLCDDGSPKIPFIVSSYAPDEFVKESFRSIQQTEQKIRMGWIATALSALSPFSLQGIQLLTSRDTIDFEEFRTQKTAIFLNVPVGIADSYQTLISLFYTQFFRFLLNKPVDATTLPCYIYLEELANSRVPQLEKYIALLRGREVHMICVLQSLSQLEHEYSEQVARTIINNCSNIIVYPGTKDQASLRFIASLLGQRNGDGTSKGGRKEELMSPYAIRTMEHALLIASDKPAMKFYPTPIYKNRKLMKKADIISVDGRLISFIPYQLPMHGLPLVIPQYMFESKEDKERKEREEELNKILQTKT